MKSKLHSLPIVVVAMAMAACLYGWSTSRDWDAEARKRKADYIYLEGQNAYGREAYDDYVMLARRAYELDSADYDIAAEWGMTVLANANSDSATMAKAYDYVKRRFFSNPNDYLTGVVFGNVAKRMRKYSDVVKVWEALDSAFPEMNQPADELASAYLVNFILGDSASYDKALALYDRKEKGNGKSISLSSQKIRAYSIKQDTAAILREIEELTNFAPNDPYAMLFAGSNYQYVKDNAKALEYYSRACALDSTVGEAYMAKAQLYSEMGDSAAYDREVFHALKSQNLEVEPKLEILRSYVSELYSDPTQERRIRELFYELEQMHTGEPEIHGLYGAYLYEIKDYKGAAEEMSYAVALDPSNEGSWLSLVQMSGMAGDTTGMIDYALEAAVKFPEDLYFPISAAEGYRNLGQIDKAIAVMDSTYIPEVNNVQAVSSFQSFRGDLLAIAGDTAQALKAYDQAIDINPDNYLALNNAAYYMAENNIDLDKAEQFISKVIRNISDNPTYLDTYAWVFFKKKDYSLAKQYIDMTLNLYLSDEPVSDAEDGADIVADQAEAEEPAADVLEHAGDIYFMNGEPDKAVEFWQQAYAKDSGNELLERKVKHKTYFYK